MKGLGVLFICFVGVLAWFYSVSFVTYLAGGPSAVPQQQATLDPDTNQRVFARDYNKEMVQRENRLRQVSSTFFRLRSPRKCINIFI